MGKMYDLNQYFNLNEGRKTTCIEIYPGNETAAKLLVHHKQQGAKELSLADCVDENAAALPMPDEMMIELDKKIMAAGKRVVVTGIDAYLRLLDKTNVGYFMTALNDHIMKGKLNAAYMMGSLRFDHSKFLNPQLLDSLSVVYLKDPEKELPQTAVTIVPKAWVQVENHPADWKALLKKLGPFEPIDDSTLVLENYRCKQAGLSDSVTQLLTIREIAAHYYNLPEQLADDVLEVLIPKCREAHTKHPNDILRELFDPKNLTLRLAPKRLMELQNDVLWPAFVWFLKETIEPDSYFARVLEFGIEKENLLEKYVSAAAFALLTDANAARYAAERRDAVKEIGSIAESMVVQFLSSVKNESNDRTAPWFNCGTEAERIEIVRRVSQSDLTIGLPEIWHNLYVPLEDYLSDQYDYGDSGLTSYFQEYRRLKVAEKVTKEFVKKAFDAAVPASVPLRDSVLNEFSSQSDTTLLLVDGMGAEYYPLLLSMAKRRGFHIQNSEIAQVRLPSSTEFNKNQWNAALRFESSIYQIDTISHEGAKKHEKCSPAHNLAAALDVFEYVFNRISAALAVHEYVILSADHGSSRLAVLASENHLCETLPWKGEPNNWRFAEAPKNTKRPATFESVFDAERNITFWVVRGYNRLPKQGGKLCVHGGATLEERLVPVLLFSKQENETTAASVPASAPVQLVEKMEFDGI